MTKRVLTKMFLQVMAGLAVASLATLVLAPMAAGTMAWPVAGVGLAVSLGCFAAAAWVSRRML